MKYLAIAFFSLSIISCNKTNSEKSAIEIQEGKYLWTAEWTNGVQENPRDMTKTVYTFLSITDQKNAVCEKQNLIVTTVYKEIWRNDNTAVKPVWSLKNGENEVIDYDKAFLAVCENDKAVYGIVNLDKFDYPFLDRYPLFKKEI